MTKTILILAIAAIFVTGTLVSGTLAFAQKPPTAQPFDALTLAVNNLQKQVDSFFDIFTELRAADDALEIAINEEGVQRQAADSAQQARIDSFFDVFFKMQKTHSTTISPLEMPLASLYYVKFEGVEGDSLDKDHKGWCDLGSFTQGQHAPSERRKGDVILDDIVIVKPLDKCSPKLAEAALTGRVFPKVQIEVATSFLDSGRVTYYAYELKDVQVSSYHISGSGQNDSVPVDEMALNFKEIKVTYTEYDHAGKKKGTVEYSWKVEEGEK